jgi:hypothetical protein
LARPLRLTSSNTTTLPVAPVPFAFSSVAESSFRRIRQLPERVPQLLRIAQNARTKTIEPFTRDCTWHRYGIAADKTARPAGARGCGGGWGVGGGGGGVACGGGGKRVGSAATTAVNALLHASRNRRAEGFWSLWHGCTRATHFCRNILHLWQSVFDTKDRLLIVHMDHRSEWVIRDSCGVYISKPQARMIRKNMTTAGSAPSAMTAGRFAVNTEIVTP